MKISGRTQYVAVLAVCIAVTASQAQCLLLMSEGNVRSLSGEVTEVELFGSCTTSLTGDDVRGQGYRIDDRILIKVEGRDPVEGRITENYLAAIPGQMYISVSQKKDTVSLGYGFAPLNYEVGTRFSLEFMDRGHPEDFAKQAAGKLARDQCRSDEQFCNLYSSTFGGVIGDGILYRSCDSFTVTAEGDLMNNGMYDAYGIGNILSLYCNDEYIEGRIDDGATGTSFDLYGQGRVHAEVMTVNIIREPESIRSAMHYIIDSDGPLLVQCQLGKDRTSIIIQMLALFMGADHRDVIEDFCRSFCNLYGIEEGSSEYQRLYDEYGRRLVIAMCDSSFYSGDPLLCGWDMDLENVDTRELMVQYLTGFVGMTEEELTALHDRLAPVRQYIYRRPHMAVPCPRAVRNA